MKIRVRLLLLLGLVIITILLVTLLVVMQVRLNNLRAQKEVLSKEVADYSEKIDKLNYFNSLSEEEYIIRFSRESLGYHNNDEIIFKFNYGE